MALFARLIVLIAFLAVAVADVARAEGFVSALNGIALGTRLLLAELE